jgi:hypothetical protein
VAARSGQAVAQNNPPGFTKEVADNFDAEKIKAYKERITDPADRGIGIRSKAPGSTSATDDLRKANQGARDAYNDSLPQSERALKGVRDVDHTVELQDIIRGDAAPGANTVRPQDHRIQPSRLNSSQGSSNQKVVAKQLAEGAPVDTPAGGVARTRDIGKFTNQEGFTTGARWGGYA